jgi:hypothetical protein
MMAEWFAKRANNELEIDESEEEEEVEEEDEGEEEAEERREDTFGVDRMGEGGVQSMWSSTGASKASSDEDR